MNLKKRQQKISRLKYNKKKQTSRRTWLAQSVEHMTLHLWVMSSSPTMGVELTFKKGGGGEKEKVRREGKKGKEKMDF